MPLEGNRQPLRYGRRGLGVPRGRLLRPRRADTRTVSADAVTGEWPPGPVGAVHARRETHDQELWLRVAERRYGLAVIVGKLVRG